MEKTNLKSFAFANLKFKYAKVIWMFYRKPYSKKWDHYIIKVLENYLKIM